MKFQSAIEDDGSAYAWLRLGIALLLGTIGGASMYIVGVVLPSVQAEFGVSRGDASLRGLARLEYSFRAVAQYGSFHSRPQ